jgi:deazaflavin-dependent oxidoreductase (nitroreductase family)
MLVVPQWPLYLYLTTTGRISGQRHEIEIWFTEHGGHFYLIAERESANWVRNIQSQPRVKVRIGDAEFNAIGRVVHDDREPQLEAIVKALFDATSRSTWIMVCHWASRAAVDRRHSRNWPIGPSKVIPHRIVGERLLESKTVEIQAY